MEGEDEDEVISCGEGVSEVDVAEGVNSASRTLLKTVVGTARVRLTCDQTVLRWKGDLNPTIRWDACGYAQLEGVVAKRVNRAVTHFNIAIDGSRGSDHLSGK